MAVPSALASMGRKRGGAGKGGKSGGGKAGGTGGGPRPVNDTLNVIDGPPVNVISVETPGP